MTDAILLVGHGTRNPQGTAQFLRLSELLRASVAPLPLEVGFIELQEPTIETALVNLSQRGLRQILLSPALLFAAGHAKQDIPAAVERAKSVQPDLQVTMAEPLGCHKALIELAALRFLGSLSPIHRAEDRGEGPASQQDPAPSPIQPVDPAKTALVLIGRGSSDPAAIEHCREFAALLGEKVGAAGVYTGFIAVAKPSLPEVLEQAAAAGFERIVVQPHLLFSGEMLETTTAAVSHARQTHPRVEWRQAGILGSDLLATNGLAAQHLIQALLERLEIDDR
ncbi:Sirohydrochlorin cobaltochelatase [Anatilimnocola aggregata]|uniref:Sirohydrochlorin cobaltochelatase n=1 Tax=Anatilimnocola aggregata TaxID=2528021 RepID=A0A517YBK2_9BACT|nr:CbiX/SirB N-terminal domain-containing protein [Anatilimnocola aggregata]QDU27626.1 Sirohydrochlorin cobaltochelatase [Anatilimnocola aggregata]